jgi:hypothetical protein
MAYLREKQVEGPTKRWARKNGWYVRKYSSPGKRSVPDDIFIRKGRVVFIEFKATNSKPTPQQWEELQELREQGMHADWSDDPELAKLILRGLVSVPGVGDRSHPRTRVCDRAAAEELDSKEKRVSRVDRRVKRKKASKRERSIPVYEDSWFE